MAMFMNAPEDIKRQLRAKAWKKCCEQLGALRSMLDRPPAEARVNKYVVNLAEGYTREEARRMQKARKRAANHQRSLAENPNLKFEDLPKSLFKPGGSTRVLELG